VDESASDLVQSKTSRVFSIGHSNQTLEDFLTLLERYGIEVLVDIRSYPYSKFTTQFNSPELKTAVTRSGLKYLFMGKELGGRPDDLALYDETGRVKYWQVARTALFLEGLSRLLKGQETYRVALMCSEEDPQGCHRHLLVSRVLAERGVEVGHIRGDGSLQTEAELRNQGQASSAQMTLFSDEEYTEWKSIRPVLPKKLPPNFSRP
jgi:uncharacterized protein (DUF488 family)